MARVTIEYIVRVLPYSGDVCVWFRSETPLARWHLDCISGEWIKVPF